MGVGGGEGVVVGRGRRGLVLVLFVRLFDLCLFGFVGFLFHLVSGRGWFVIVALSGLSLTFLSIGTLNMPLYYRRFENTFLSYPLLPPGRLEENSMFPRMFETLKYGCISNTISLLQRPLEVRTFGNGVCNVSQSFSVVSALVLFVKFQILLWILIKID